MNKTNNLNDIFASRNGKSVFLPYVCCGDPNEAFTLKLVDTLVANGASGIELGIPFSDPIADGKTIQGATERSLRAGMTPDKALLTVERIRKKHSEIVIMVMTYYNIVFSNGLQEFVQRAKIAGANGLIVPDVPLEESDELDRACKNSGIALVRFVTPNMTDERLDRVLACADGFVYAVSVFGTTGARVDISKSAIDLIGRVRVRSSVPVVVGFGIQTPKHTAQYLAAGAKGIIIGSAIIDAYLPGIAGKNETAALKAVSKLTKEICKAKV